MADKRRQLESEVYIYHATTKQDLDNVYINTHQKPVSMVIRMPHCIPLNISMSLCFSQPERPCHLSINGCMRACMRSIFAEAGWYRGGVPYSRLAGWGLGLGAGAACCIRGVGGGGPTPHNWVNLISARPICSNTTRKMRSIKPPGEGQAQ